MDITSSKAANLLPAQIDSTEYDYDDAFVTLLAYVSDRFGSCAEAIGKCLLTCIYESLSNVWKLQVEDQISLSDATESLLGELLKIRCVSFGTFSSEMDSLTRRVANECRKCAKKTAFSFEGSHLPENRAMSIEDVVEKGMEEGIRGLVDSATGVEFLKSLFLRDAYGIMVSFNTHAELAKLQESILSNTENFILNLPEVRDLREAARKEVDCLKSHNKSLGELQDARNAREFIASIVEEIAKRHCHRVVLPEIDKHMDIVWERSLKNSLFLGEGGSLRPLGGKYKQDIYRGFKNDITAMLDIVVTKVIIEIRESCIATSKNT